MSDPVSPDVPVSAAFRELEHLVRNLGEEVGTFRKLRSRLRRGSRR